MALIRNNTESVSPAQFYAAVTPSDSAGFTVNARGLWIGTAGNVAVVGLDGTVVTLKNVANGTLIPAACIRVNSTNTTATDIVALF